MNVFSSFFGNLGKFWQGSLNSRFFRYSLFLFLAQIVIITWFYNQLPPEIPIYFSRPWGQSWLSSSASIFILPLFSLITLLINYFLALYFYTKKILLSQLLVIFGFIISLFSIISLLQIINLAI
ncbi:MAG TPA: hypothetical protein PKI92_02250 [Candidatus Woesebacteria bacterium]|nr:hypothetical protein [Candidatus Woesebacteria bacterium]HPR99784.1 hypothetical protein [Candidatus Woesebacteria bacterium]